MRSHEKRVEREKARRTQGGTTGNSIFNYQVKEEEYEKLTEKEQLKEENP